MSSDKFIFHCEMISDLKKNAELSIRAASDWGVPHKSGVIIPKTKMPKLKKRIKKLKHLPENIIFNLIELKNLENHTMRILDELFDNDFPLDPMSFFITRQLYATKIGIKSLIIAEKIRRIAGLPPDRLSFGNEAPEITLKHHWKNNIKCQVNIQKKADP